MTMDKRLQFGKADVYVRQVCEQIRWKKAHAVIEGELLAHIEDQKEAFLEKGIPVAEAEIMAIAEMGSPVETGNRFDQIYRPKIEWNVVLLVSMLLFMGTVLRLTILSAIGEEIHLLQELWYLPVGLAMMALGYWLDYTVLLVGSKLKCLTVTFAYLAIYALVAFLAIPL